MKYKIINLKEHEELINKAADWFHEKWGIPLEAYLDSMNEGLKSNTIPCWYLTLCGNEIVGGLGVIENDFHPRKDLAPNVCAVYVEEEHRNKHNAGKMLNKVCLDLSKKGITTLYLVTNHTGFYERYDWKYYCDVLCDGEEKMSRIYIHKC